MSLRIRFRFDGRCSMHPRYNPQKDSRPQHSDCPGCESLYVISLYSRIACRRAATGDGMIVSNRETFAQNSDASSECQDDSSPSSDDPGT